MKSINLSAPPSSWEALNEKQLFAIHKLSLKRYPEAEFKIRVFLMLLGLKICRRARKNDDGTFTYFLRRKGFLHWLMRERISMQSWEFDHYISKYLSFLDDRYKLTALPCGFIRVGWHRYRVPDRLLLSITWQQYGNAQRCLERFWRHAETAEELLKNGGTRKAVRIQQREALKARSEFMAHLYNTWSFQVLESKEARVKLRLTKVWQYDPETARRQVRVFMKAPEELFLVTDQFFQSCLSHYKVLFPKLFKQSSGKNKTTSRRAPLVIELETVNTIKRECHYDNQQEVYDTNAAFIFEDLSMLAERHEQMEKMNAKLKKKQK